MVWWEELGSAAEAREKERDFKQHYGEPPQPRSQYEGCVNGGALLSRIIEVAGTESW